MRRSIQFATLAAIIALTTWACGGATTATSPTSPLIPTTTETFQGTLTPNGAQVYSFSSLVGTITETLTTVSPDATAAIGLSIGTWDGSSCTTFKANDNAIQGTVVTVGVTVAGPVCARVYDVGKLTGTINFTVTLEHP